MNALDRPLIVASNRGPVTFERDETGTLVPGRGSGGLVTALIGALLEAEGLWVAAAMSDGDRAMVAESDRGRVDMGKYGSRYRLRYLDIPPAIYDGYYNGISNGILWFAHHYLWDTVRSPTFGWEVDAAEYGNESRFINCYRGLAPEPNVGIIAVWTPSVGSNT